MHADVDGVFVLAERRVVRALTVNQIIGIVVRMAARQLVHHRRHLPLVLLLTHLNPDAVARHGGDLLIVGGRQRAAGPFLGSFPDGTRVALDGVLDQELRVVDAFLVGSGDLHQAFLRPGVYWKWRFD